MIWWWRRRHPDLCRRCAHARLLHEHWRASTRCGVCPCKGWR